MTSPFALCVYRAFTQSIAYDETLTWELYTSGPVSNIFHLLWVRDQPTSADLICAGFRYSGTGPLREATDPIAIPGAVRSIRALARFRLQSLDDIEGRPPGDLAGDGG